MPAERTSGETNDHGRRAAAISNAINRLHHEHYGRGGTTTRTIIQRNYVVCFLEDIYTPGERTLLGSGQQLSVRQTRQIFQDAMRERFVAAVEEIMERKTSRSCRRCTSTPTSPGGIRAGAARRRPGARRLGQRLTTLSDDRLPLTATSSS